MSDNGNPVAIAKRPTTTVEHFNPDDPVSLYMQTSVFEQLQRVAKLMSNSALVPAHLRGDDKTPDCFLVAAQAFRWRMDPFAVAQHTYVLSGKLGYEGKLIAAVINASPRLDQRLNYEYSGSGTARRVVVSGRLKGEKTVRTVDGSIAQWATDRNPKWKDLPDQMLAYRGAREWARRHMPEAVLGVFAEEEIDQMARPTTVTISTETLDDFVTPEKVIAANDPKAEPKTVEAEIVPKKAEKKLKPEDQAVTDLFGGEV